MKRLKSLFTRESGSLLAEYAVMVSLLAVTALAALVFFSGNTHRPLVGADPAMQQDAGKAGFIPDGGTRDDILPKNFYAIPQGDRN